MIICFPREEVYRKNGVTNTFNLFKNGQISKEKLQGVIEYLKGLELAIYCAEELQRSGYDPRVEVPVGNTKADVVAGDMAIECKAVYDLNKCKKLKNQISGYKTGNYKRVILYLCLDTRVSKKLRRELKRDNVQIIRADITREDLKDRVLKLL